ncbi:MAG: PDZ domain-containing protein [Polyangiaceae bacterium]|nr:PDZ domain-containing protein [Polyangiaceae bacterium]
MRRPLLPALALALSAALGAPAVGCGTGAVGSIGAVLRSDPATGAVVVRTVPEGLAAAEAGLEEGDVIKMVDGVLVDGLKKAKLQALLRGEVGTYVELTVLRGELVLRLEVLRQALVERAAPTKRPAHDEDEDD